MCWGVRSAKEAYPEVEPVVWQNPANGMDIRVATVKGWGWDTDAHAAGRLRLDITTRPTPSLGPSFANLLPRPHGTGPGPVQPTHLDQDP